jgi:Holliday junction resolvase RusA-like endonuclease
MEIRLTVHTVPIAKSRPQFTRGRCFTPKRTVDYETLIGTAARGGGNPPKPLTGPLSVDITFAVEKPKSAKRTAPTARPDLDNYIKAVLDALNGIFWHDDAQIVEITARKVYTVEAPFVDLLVKEI